MSFTEYFTATAMILFIVLLFLVYRLNRKINRLHYTTVDWVDSELKALKNKIAGLASELQTVDHDLDEVAAEKLPEICDSLENMGKNLENILHRTENLEKGIVPDFEQAREAAKAVDDFNAGLSGILGFDPIETAKRQRKERNAEG